MRDFEIDKTGEQADTFAPELKPLLRNLFPNAIEGRRERDPEKQRAGIDLHIIVPHGPPITLDFKFRSGVWDDFALEVGHQSHDGQRAWDGWIRETNKRNDLIAYVFKPVPCCWLLPRARLQQAWARNEDTWREQYGFRTSENRDYMTFFCPVPIGVVCTVVGGVRFANSEKAETIKRDGSFFEHYCACGEWGAFGFEAPLPPRMHGWFCNEHRPDKGESRS